MLTPELAWARGGFGGEKLRVGLALLPLRAGLTEQLKLNLYGEQSGSQFNPDRRLMLQAEYRF